jgi:hypothetical protein
MSENMVTESREVSGFDGVDLGGFGSLLIVQGDHTELTVEAPKDLIRRVTSEVRDGVLFLDIRRGPWLLGLRNENRTIRFRLTMDSIRTLRLGGVGRIDAPEIRTKSLSVVVSGVGGVEIADLQSDSLDALVSGAGRCEIAGHTESQTIKLSGSGSYNARELETRTTTAIVSGAGAVTVRVLDTLDAKVSGAGSIHYYGAPTVRQRVTGVGSITCVCNE